MVHINIITHSLTQTHSIVIVGFVKWQNMRGIQPSAVHINLIKIQDS